MIVVYTALFGPGCPESLPSPPKEHGIRYVCITGHRLPPLSDWEYIHQPYGANPRHAARMAKVTPHILFPDATITVWMDASFTWKQSPRKAINDAIERDAFVVGFKHPDRQRMVEEAAEVIRCEQAPKADVSRQVAMYRTMGFDTDAQPQTVLTTTGLLIRRRSTQAERFNEMWRDQLLEYTLRDQLSIDYVGWLLDVKIGHLPGPYRDNAYVQYHRNRRIKAA